MGITLGSEEGYLIWNGNQVFNVNDDHIIGEVDKSYNNCNYRKGIFTKKDCKYSDASKPKNYLTAKNLKSIRKINKNKLEEFVNTFEASNINTIFDNKIFKINYLFKEEILTNVLIEKIFI